MATDGSNCISVTNPPPMVQIAVQGLMDTTPDDNLDSGSDHDGDCQFLNP